MCLKFQIIMKKTSSFALVPAHLDEDGVVVDGVDGAGDAVVVVLELAHLGAVVALVVVAGRGGREGRHHGAEDGEGAHLQRSGDKG